MSTEHGPRITIAANQGEVGGGEVMLLAIAEGARDLGHDVTVVAPETPGDVAAEARRRGFETITVPGSTSSRYLAHLRRWDARNRQGVLWCNGLRPALATAGHAHRVVHLHQEPRGKQAWLARIARLRTISTLVPSQYMAARLPGSIVLENWTAPVVPRPSDPTGGPYRIGYLGRLSADKGVPTLCHAVELLVAEGADVQLVLAGESRFVGANETRVVDEAVAALGEYATRTGWIERDEFFSTVDLAVFPSVAEESFGLVAAEAMAARCPFVVSDAGALPEVAGGDYPFVAPRGDARRLANVIRSAMTEPNWPERLDSSHDRWTAEFSPPAGRERLLAFLRRIKPYLRSDQ